MLTQILHIGSRHPVPSKQQRNIVELCTSPTLPRPKEKFKTVGHSKGKSDKWSKGETLINILLASKVLLDYLRPVITNPIQSHPSIPTYSCDDDLSIEDLINKSNQPTDEYQ